ncbi:MAG: hypothetical protein AB7O49_14835 [Sphingomonadales bacterium]
MKLLRLSSFLVLAAGIAVLCSAAQAQTKAASDGQPVKDGKRAHADSTQPADVHQMRTQSAGKEEPAESDMILLQEPLRSGPAMPVSLTRGR